MENNSKRIAKNTLFMYFRMLFLLFISLFSVRVVLANLGVEDYGIYNLVASVVVLFNFILNSSSAATSRYLNYALGENDLNRANSIYNCSFIIHLIIVFIVVILLESVGLWLLNNYLVIPSNRMFAANCVFHLSVFTTALNILNIPNHATVIANEKMSFYAIMSIFEGLLKLLSAYVISISKFDKLIVYGLLITGTHILVFFVNLIYVKTKFSICRFKIVKDKNLYKELLSFSGWSLFSSIGSTCSNQVLTMILNKFYGVIANAAMGIANQVNNTVYQFISNFQVAFEPQIIKSYAAQEKEYLEKLIFRTSKFSFFLLWFFVLPLSLNAPIVLKVWLVEVPEYAVVFLRIILIYSLIDALVGPLWMVSYAIGNIRNYQIVAFIMSFLTVPIAWILLKLGFPPYWIIILRVMSNLLFSMWRLGYLKNRMNFPVMNFIRKVFIPSLFVCVISFIVTYSIYILLVNNNVVQFFLSCSISVIINVVLMIFIGCGKEEKEYIKIIVKNLCRRNKCKH